MRQPYSYGPNNPIRYSYPTGLGPEDQGRALRIGMLPGVVAAGADLRLGRAGWYEWGIDESA